MAVLFVKDFSFTYPNGKEILHHLSFSLEKGEMLLLCGENGCGKSTLLRSLKAEVAPKGIKSGLIEQHADSQILFQECDKNIIFKNTWDDLIFPACNAGLPEETIVQKADEILRLFGIEHLKHRSTLTLSGGEKQLLSLASLLILEPELLLLDEPLSQLDEQAKETFLEKLQLIKTSGTAIIIAEHNTDRLLEMSDKYLIFENGNTTLYSKQTLARKAVFPNAPEYIQLENKLRLPLTDLSRAEAVKGLCGRKEDIAVHPMPRSAKGGEEVLGCENVSFRYGKNEVLEALSLSLYKGQAAFITGANGAGKSTLLYLICGLLKPVQGSIRLGAEHKTGYLAQNPMYSFLKDTLDADFRYILKKNGLPAKRLEEIFNAYPLFEDLRTLLSANPLDLSGGERAKAAIFKLLLLQRDVLLLDEPEKHLDKTAVLELGNIIRALCAQGVSFLIVSHNPDFIFRTADSVHEICHHQMKHYLPEGYFPARSKTSLYRAVEAAGLEILDCSQVEVAHG